MRPKMGARWGMSACPSVVGWMTIERRSSGCLRRRLTFREVLLAGVGAGGLPLAQAKARYEAQMLRDGFQAVAESLNKPFLRPAGQPQRPGPV